MESRDTENLQINECQPYSITEGWHISYPLSYLTVTDKASEHQVCGLKKETFSLHKAEAQQILSGADHFKLGPEG